MKEIREYPDRTALESALQADRWNSKLQVLADSLLHHIREEEEDERHEAKGVYIDFKELK
ncbi:MAG TPA: hypothetical protein VFO86_00725 [Terriglobia bacterium]|nr:hypothetical protein [Terriglobia bacterium]